MKTQQDSSSKTCFLITPIGAPESLDRKRVDQWLNLIYKPSVKGKYKLVRADKISTSGVSTKQIIDHIIDADLVIIDFTPPYGQTTPNANVMYEAAIRHVAQKPLIQIKPDNLTMPFDIKDFRCIVYDPLNLQHPKLLKDEVIKAIKEIESSGYIPPDIIGHTFDLERIVSDPAKFIEILREKFNDQLTPRLEPYLPVGNGYPGVSLVSNNGGYNSSVPINAVSTQIGVSYQANCPVCGNIGTQISPISYTSNFYNQGQKQFRCGVCGNIFYGHIY